MRPRLWLKIAHIGVWAFRLNAVSCRAVRFELLGELQAIEVIASGVGIRDRRRLNRVYGRAKWRKMKGVATVRLADGTICEAELHWYEAHGIGKRELKLKKPLG